MNRPTDPLRDKIAVAVRKSTNLEIGPVTADVIADEVVLAVRRWATSDAAVKRFRELIGAETNCYLTLAGAKAAITAALGGKP